MRKVTISMFDLTRNLKIIMFGLIENLKIIMFDLSLRILNELFIFYFLFLISYYS